MPLSVGDKLGPYEILAPLGAGGMGEVYRARDTKLGREVALKVLPDVFASDPDRLARFEREARLLASLNHPNIAAIYGLEQSGGRPLLVMELVPGATLAERLDHGALAVEEALRICARIAEALEAAHEKGVIHRDLKPANVKITPDGKVKVLDFGLAKAFAGEAASLDVSASPTRTVSATRAGVILGTAAYMSPEQARGKPLDRRTDIWSFGCVLFETLTGRRTFPSDTISDAIAGILAREPEWSALPAAVPLRTRDLLRRCLEKDIHRRLRDIGDARIEIEDTLAAGPAMTPAAPITRPRNSRMLLVALGCAMLGALAAGSVVWGLKSAASQSSAAPLHLAVTLPDKEPLAMDDYPVIALSPDGSRLVYVGRSGVSNTRLYMRTLDQFEAKPIPGTDGAAAPFFSPDGQWVAFFADRKLKKVSAAGGPVTAISEDPAAGATWGPDDRIYFTSPRTNALARMPASGGKPEDVTQLDPTRGESFHYWPQVLPGAQAVLFTVLRGPSAENARVDLLSFKTGKRHTVIESGAGARYLSTGYLVYSRAGALLAVPFALDRLEVTGPAVSALEGVLPSEDDAGHFSISGNGRLAYIPGGAAASDRSLVWVDRKGAVQPLTETHRAYEDLDLSPDSRHLAMTIEGPAWNIWLYDLTRGTLSPFTLEHDNRDPIWTPDGKRIVYGSFRNGRYGFYWKPADGSGSEEQLTSSQYWHAPMCWSPDGKLLVFLQTAAVTGEDIWVLPIDGERKPRPLLQTKFTEAWADVSPDGHWFAYTSNESGRYEVYVQAFPDLGNKSQVSTEGGTRPLWARDGRELFYRNGDQMLTVPVQLKPTFSAGAPKALFEGRYLANGHDYDMARDGRFVLMREAAQKIANTPIYIVDNWFDEVNRRTTARKP